MIEIYLRKILLSKNLTTTLLNSNNWFSLFTISFTTFLSSFSLNWLSRFIFINLIKLFFTSRFTFIICSFLSFSSLNLSHLFLIFTSSFLFSTLRFLELLLFNLFTFCFNSRGFIFIIFIFIIRIGLTLFYSLLFIGSYFQNLFSKLFLQFISG